MYQLSKTAKRSLDGKVQLAEALSFLGFNFTAQWWVSFGYSLGRILDDPVNLSDYQKALTEAREQAMRTKDFQRVDSLKSMLVEAGVEVRMSKQGVELVPGAGFDATKLEG